MLNLITKEAPIEDGGIGKIKYPLVSDVSKEISRSYGVLLEEEGVVDFLSKYSKR